MPSDSNLRSDEREIVGLFVGGRGTRMGGVAKGNLQLASGERLIERLITVTQRALGSPRFVLVGAAESYSALGLPALADSPPGIGPLGGLRSLLLHARECERSFALALACDLPYLEAGIVRRLATESPAATFVAPRAEGRWDTLVARYSVSALAAIESTLARGERALQRVVAELGPSAVELELDEAERLELRDWDTPADRPQN